MDGCIGVFEVVKFHTKRHRAEENSNWEFVPAQRSSTGKILTYKLAEREEMRFEQFGGLTFHEQWRKLEAEC